MKKRGELWGGYRPKRRLDFKAGPSDFRFLPQNLTRRRGCLVPLTRGMKPVLQLSAPRTHLWDLARTIRWRAGSQTGPILFFPNRRKEKEYLHLTAKEKHASQV